MNVPNVLTCVRIVLAGVFLVLFLEADATLKFVALAVFLTASATDYLDGKIARSTGQITPFGQLMDPIADKLLTLSAFGSFVALGFLPLWTVLVVAGRDVLLTITRLFMKSGDKQAAHSSGKKKTAFQLFYIVAAVTIIAVRETASWKPAWESPARQFIHYGMLLVVAYTVWSGVQYLAAVRRAPAPR